jgi:hypothetical protein
MIDQSETLSSSYIIFSTLISACAQCCCTFHHQPWQCAQLCGAKTHFLEPDNHFLEPDGHALDFLHPVLLCRITYRAPVEMLLELGNLTPGHLHNIPGQVHALMVTRVNQQPPAHHPLEALLWLSCGWTPTEWTLHFPLRTYPVKKGSCKLVLGTPPRK